MKLSKYIVVKEIGGDYILFSTISKKIIKVTKEFYNELIHLDIERLKMIKQDELEYLKKSFFVIEDNIDEKKLVEFLLDKDRLNQKIFSGYIAFSTLCNFACVYCYEEGQTNRNCIMDSETLTSAVEWYKKKLLEGHYKECKITLFGGEPLIHKDLIKIFVSSLSKFANKNQIKLRLAIITNGFLLDQEIVDFLNLNGLEEIQITLDGVGDIHNARRPLRSGGKTFDKIINNISTLKKFNGRFLIRVSFDRNNVLHVKELLQYIKNLRLNNACEVYLAPIHQTTIQNSQSCSFCSKNTSTDLDEIILQYKELYKYMADMGLDVPKYISNGPCMTVSLDTVLVDPKGNLFKCVEMIGVKNLSVGNVIDNDYSQNISNFVGCPCFKRCIKKGCKYVCLCGGGCLMKSYLQDQSTNNIDCQYKLFEELIPVLLELNYGNK